MPGQNSSISAGNKMMATCRSRQAGHHLHNVEQRNSTYKVQLDNVWTVSVQIPCLLYGTECRSESLYFVCCIRGVRRGNYE
jgi:hypothetical protein